MRGHNDAPQQANMFIKAKNERPYEVGYGNQIAARRAIHDRIGYESDRFYRGVERQQVTFLCALPEWIRPRFSGRRRGQEAGSDDWLAGDAVALAPCSTRFPCKQGILQGNSRSRQSSDPRDANFLCALSALDQNSPREITGNYFWRAVKTLSRNREFLFPRSGIIFVSKVFRK